MAGSDRAPNASAGSTNPARPVWLALVAGVAYGMAALTVLELIVAWQDWRRGPVRLTTPAISFVGSSEVYPPTVITLPSGAGQDLVAAAVFFTLAALVAVSVWRLCRLRYPRRSRGRRLGLLLGVPASLIIGPALGLGVGWSLHRIVG